MTVRKSTREKYSDRFKTHFDSIEEWIEHAFYKDFDPKEIEDHLEAMELRELQEEYRNKTIYIDGKPIGAHPKNPKDDEGNPLEL